VFDAQYNSIFGRNMLSNLIKNHGKLIFKFLFHIVVEFLFLFAERLNVDVHRGLDQVVVIIELPTSKQ
jgi:hypothetical protein